jgi:DNA repair exonuclease SbcCD ATPase subunit|nr:MAG TPA: STRUCTURAL MAINTENANCE OF CHROMOSOMES PROTEIN [Caudoviricetes sp.]
MKILYLKLTNFINIVTAFNTETIEIDFSKSNNNVVLLTGPNGSGKTSILSCLHPFPTNGNMDVRSDNPIIVPRENGYKEIHISDCDDLYVIQHFYTRNSDKHIIKSYIQKNGVELNENGNVTSFKEIVEKELGLEQDYMKLTRLGSNVTNFIDMKRQERKNFTGKIISEADIYLSYHKKIMADKNKVNIQINHTSDLIRRLQVDDLGELKKAQKSLQHQIEDLTAKIEKVNSELSVLQYQLNDCGDIPAMRDRIQEKEKELKHIQKALARASEIKISISTLKSMIEEAKIAILKAKSSLDTNVITRTGILNQLDSIANEIDSIRREIARIEDDQNVKDMEANIELLRETIRRRAKESGIAGYVRPCSKAEMEDLIKMLDKCMDILLSTYELGKGPIQKAVSFFHTKTDIEKYTRENREKIKRNRMQSLCEQVYAEISKDIGLLGPDCKNPSGCRVYDFYQRIYEYATQAPDKVIEDETFLAYTKMAYNNIQTVLKYLRDYHDIFEKMPECIKDQFMMSTVLTHICNMEWIYDKDIIFHELGLITDDELQDADLEELNRQKSMLAQYKKANSNIEYFQNKLEELINSRTTLMGQLDEVKETINSLNREIAEKEASVSDYEDMVVAMEHEDEVETEFNDLKSKLTLASQLSLQIREKTSVLNDLQFRKNKMSKTHQDNEFRIENYKRYKKDLDELSSKFTDLEYLARALSSREGIPLIFIQAYLKDIKDIANQLLDVVYDGDLHLEDFEITADEFGIPYSTKGTTVKDVIYASQGERSFISLALSFALTYKSISKYNIMLLDEIDATLDISNREKFLHVLEMQIDMIHAEQVFVISHNDMFNAYPVDIVDTRNRTSSNAELASYIPIEKS